MYHSADSVGIPAVCILARMPLAIGKGTQISATAGEEVETRDGLGGRNYTSCCHWQPDLLNLTVLCCEKGPVSNLGEATMSNCIDQLGMKVTADPGLLQTGAHLHLTVQGVLAKLHTTGPLLKASFKSQVGRLALLCVSLGTCPRTSSGTNATGWPLLWQSLYLFCQIFRS